MRELIKKECPNCGKFFEDAHEGVDSIILYGSCCECHKGTRETTQRLKIHVYYRWHKGLSLEEAMEHASRYNPDNAGTKWEVSNFAGCGDCSGGCGGCG